MPGDFTPIAIVGSTPIVLVVNPNKVPAKDHKEFAALLKAKPDELTYALGRQRHDPAPGRRACTSTRSAPRRATSRTRASAPMVTDLIGGQIDFGTLALPQRAGSTSRAARCAPSASAARSARRPRPRSRPSPSRACRATWSRPGSRVLGPKGMSAADVKRVHDAVVAAFADPAVKDAMAKQGNTINVSTSEHRASRTSAARRTSTPSW